MIYSSKGCINSGSINGSINGSYRGIVSDRQRHRSGRGTTAVAPRSLDPRLLEASTTASITIVYCLKVFVLDKEPHSEYLPPNCTNEVGDITKDYEKSRWDYLLIRNVRDIGDWESYFNRLHGMLQSGGCIEFVDVDGEDDVVCTCPQLGDWATTCNYVTEPRGLSASKSGRANTCCICASFPSAKSRRNLLRESYLEVFETSLK